MIFRHPEGRPFVIGHRGAAAIAPENTLEALAAGLGAGADLVEFDVGEGLVLDHPGGRRAESPPSLDEALAYVASRGAGAHIDLKHSGIEARVADAVRRHGLDERVIVSSTHKAALRRLEAAAPGLTRAISYPHDSYGVSRIPWPRLVVDASAAVLRPVMEVRLPPLLRSAGAQVLSARHELVGRGLVQTVHARGGGVLAWTVNDPSEAARLVDAGVDAIVSDDPGMVLRVVATLISP